MEKAKANPHLSPQTKNQKMNTPDTAKENAKQNVIGLDAEIIANKELRRDLDAQLQKLKSLPSSRERAITITKLQEAIMWLGMDLKRLHAQQPQPTTTKTLRDLAEEAYQRYGSVTEFKNFRGDQMPNFADLPPNIIRAWEAAVSVDNGRPYPSSYDPSTSKVEPTAEGLKL